jgi:hypothetical protein
MEEAFFKRDIAAVTFAAGISFPEFKRGVGILATKKEAIEDCGGISAFAQKNPVNGMRVIAAGGRPGQSGDSVLGADLESLMLAQKQGQPQRARSVNLELLLRLAGMAEQESSGSSPAELLEVVRKVSQAVWSNPEADPGQMIQVVTQLLEELNPDHLIRALPQSRQAELAGRPAGEVATELAEDAAVEWASTRFGGSGTGQQDGGAAGEEVVRVLSRAIQTAAVAERLLQKLGQLVQRGILPATVLARVSDEMSWSSWKPTERYAHLMGLERFAAKDFRHLTDFLTRARPENLLDEANDVARHFLDCTDRGSSQERLEGMAYLPELIQAITILGSLAFVREVASRLSAQLGRSEPYHRVIAAALATAGRSLAMSEDFDSAARIGTELEASVQSDPVRHADCCGKALQNLLDDATIERLVKLNLHRSKDPMVSRSIATLLRLADAQAAEIVFRMLEVERSATERSRLLHTVRQLGEGSIRAARKRLGDERWYVVRNACMILGAMKDPNLTGHLEPALRHPDQRVQEAALTAIIRSNVPGRGAALVRALPALPAHLQESTLDELVLLKDGSALEPLEDLLLQHSSVKAGVLEKALLALAAIPDERVVDILGRILAYSEAPASLRRMAFQALKNSSYRSAQQKISEYRHHAPNDPLLRQ